MKKLFILIGIIMMMTACDQMQKKAQASELDAATTDAENSPIVETKCFLDFEFGMTEKEVDDHLRKLQKDGKVYVDRIGRNKYNFEFKGMTIILRFIPEYYEDKLYKMTYPCEVDFTGGSGHVFLQVAFRGARTGFKALINTDILGDTYYTNYKDNLIVTFKDNFMIYENAPISKLAQQKIDEDRDQKYKQSQSEF